MNERSNSVNSLQDIEIIQEHTTIFNRKNKRKHTGSTDHAITNVHGLHGSINSLLENEDIKKQVSPFITKEVVLIDTCDFSGIEEFEKNGVQVLTINGSEENLINSVKILPVSNNQNINIRIVENNNQINNRLNLEENSIENLQNSYCTEDGQILNITNPSDASVAINTSVQRKQISNNENCYENITISDKSNLIKESNDKNIVNTENNENADDLSLFGSDDWYYLNMTSDSNIDNIKNDAIYEEYDEFYGCKSKPQVETTELEKNKNRKQRNQVAIKEEVKYVKKKIKKLQAKIIKKKMQLQGKIIKKNINQVGSNIQNVIDTSDVISENIVSMKSPFITKNVNSMSLNEALDKNTKETRIVKKKIKLQGRIVRRNTKPVVANVNNVQNVINTSDEIFNDSLHIQSPFLAKNVNSVSSCKTRNKNSNEGKIVEKKIKLQGKIVKRRTKPVDTNTQSIMNTSAIYEESLNIESASNVKNVDSVSSCKDWEKKSNDVEQHLSKSINSSQGNPMINNESKVTEISAIRENIDEADTKFADSENNNPNNFIRKHPLKSKLPTLIPVRKVVYKGGQRVNCKKKIKQHKTLYKGFSRDEYQCGLHSNKISGKYDFESYLRSQTLVEVFPNFITEDEKEIWKHFKAHCMTCGKESLALQHKNKCIFCKGNLVYVCAICNKTYRTYAGLRIHVLVNLSISPKDECCKCGKGNFISLCKLRNHEQLCNFNISAICKRIPYVRLIRCDNNINAFKGPSYILQSRCWTCLITGIAFQQMKKCKECNTSLLFKCEICSKLETTYSSLCNHVLKVHNIQTHQCTMCGIVYGQEYLLEQHMRVCDSKDN